MRLKHRWSSLLIGIVLISLTLGSFPVGVYSKENVYSDLNVSFVCQDNKLVADIDFFIKDMNMFGKKLSFAADVVSLAPWGIKSFHVPLSLTGDRLSGVYRGSQSIGECKDGVYKVEVSIDSRIRKLYTVNITSDDIKYWSDNFQKTPVFIQGTLTASDGIVAFDVFVENSTDATLTLSRSNVLLNVLLYSDKYLIYSSVYDNDEKYVKYAIRPRKFLIVYPGDKKKIAVISVPVTDRKTHKGQFSLSIVVTGTPFMGSYVRIPVFDENQCEAVPDWAVEYIKHFREVGVIPWHNVAVSATRGDVVKLIGSLYRRFYLFRGEVFLDVSLGEPILGLLNNLYDMERLSGYPDKTYRPSQGLSRLEATIFLLKYIYGDSVYELVSDNQVEGIFQDVPIDKWYAPWIELAYRKGLVKGYEDGTFRPFEGITRLEVIVMLYRAYLLTK